MNKNRQPNFMVVDKSKYCKITLVPFIFLYASICLQIPASGNDVLHAVLYIELFSADENSLISSIKFPIR